MALKLRWNTYAIDGYSTVDPRSAAFVHGVPKVIVQRFELIAQPVFISFTKFLRECSRKVAHLKNTISLMKSMFIFYEHSFFEFFVTLSYLALGPWDKIRYP